MQSVSTVISSVQHYGARGIANIMAFGKYLVSPVAQVVQKMVDLVSSTLRYTGLLNCTTVSHKECSISGIPDNDTQDVISRFFKSISAEDLRKRRPINGITYLGKISNFTVFTHSAFPDNVFKFSSDGKDLHTRLRFKNHQSVIKESESLGLDQVIIPNAELIKITFSDGERYVIAEEKLNIKAGAIANLRMYSKYAEQLKPAVRQAAILICTTGLRDIKPSHLPVILSTENEQPKLAFVGFEDLDNAKMGQGLIGLDDQPSYLTELAHGLLTYFPASADEIIAEARKHLSDKQFSSIEERMQQQVDKAHKIVNRENKIAAFHKENNITKESPAIPDHVAQIIYMLASQPNPAEAPPTLDELKEIVQTINREVAANKEIGSPMMAREWRFSMLRTSNKDVIYRKINYIRGQLVPILLSSKCLHSTLKPGEASEINFNETRGYNLKKNDTLLQF